MVWKFWLLRNVEHISRIHLFDPPWAPIISDLHVTAEKQKMIPISAIAGGLILAGGIAAVVVGSRH